MGAARLLLRLAALLDPHGSPAALFVTKTVQQMLTAELGVAMTADDASDGLANLTLLSLCDLRDGRRTLDVHPVLQRSVREEAVEQIARIARYAADALLEIWPDVERDADLVEQLRNNTEALRRNAEAALWDDGLHQVVFRAGNSLWPQGLSATSLAWWRALLPPATERLGAEHADTLSIRHNIAWARHRTDDHVGALAEMRDVLTIRLRLLGPEHSNTLASRHGVAIFQEATGDRRGAADSLRALVSGYEAVLEPDARDTLNARMALACTLGAVESPRAAVAGLREVLDGYRRNPNLGAEHPETLEVELNLAGWLAGADLLDEAQTVIDRLAATSGRVLGPDHVATLKARYYAIDVLGQRGHRDEAEIAMNELLADLRPEGGDGRPEVDEIRAAIANWFDPTA
ncbi:tetratricopeptide repeat protein [Actinoplanes sp. NPDC051470]|uniref:tetratricopeptide repeat protein n=1 Tax=Actinoplanes sp. NPDC051470 TaxID=3157224 RepID=UPI0034443601